MIMFSLFFQNSEARHSSSRLACQLHEPRTRDLCGDRVDVCWKFQLVVKLAARTSDRRQLTRSGFLDERIIANALSEAGFAIADGQVSGDLVPRSQLTPTAKSLVELLRNRCEPQIAKGESAHNRCRDFCRDTPSKWWVFLGSPYTPPRRINCCNGTETSKIGQYRALLSKAGF